LPGCSARVTCARWAFSPRRTERGHPRRAAHVLNEIRWLELDAVDMGEESPFLSLAFSAGEVRKTCSTAPSSALLIDAGHGALLLFPAWVAVVTEKHQRGQATQYQHSSQKQRRPCEVSASRGRETSRRRRRDGLVAAYARPEAAASGEEGWGPPQATTGTAPACAARPPIPEPSACAGLAGLGSLSTSGRSPSEHPMARSTTVLVNDGRRLRHHHARACAPGSRSAAPPRTEGGRPCTSRWAAEPRGGASGDRRQARVAPEANLDMCAVPRRCPADGVFGPTASADPDPSGESHQPIKCIGTLARLQLFGMISYENRGSDMGVTAMSLRLRASSRPARRPITDLESRMNSRGQGIGTRCRGSRAR
jgi:hypothetical protein